MFLYGWNSISEYVLLESRSTGNYIKGIIIDDDYFTGDYPKYEVDYIMRSKIKFQKFDRVVNCLGYKNLIRRAELGEELQYLGILETYISKDAKIHPTSTISTGTLILGDVSVEFLSIIRRHCILWGGCRVCHNTTIGNGVFIASGAIIGGFCEVGDFSTIGFNSSIQEKSIIPRYTKVGANIYWPRK